MHSSETQVRGEDDGKSNKEDKNMPDPFDSKVKTWKKKNENS